MQRYVRWWRHGYRSSTGHCFDIGGTVRAALTKFEHSGEPYSGSTDPHAAGNGSLMRLAPVPMYYASHPEQAMYYAAESSRTTHGTATCLDACRYHAGLSVGALNGVNKETLLSDCWSPSSNLQLVTEEISRVAGGSYKHCEPPKIKGTGYVVDALEAALWAFHRTDNFEAGALAAVNLGDDADTTGAIYGQLAGAFYGANGIPYRWLSLLHDRSGITELALKLYRANA